jgi:hypothetical protein
MVNYSGAFYFVSSAYVTPVASIVPTEAPTEAPTQEPATQAPTQESTPAPTQEPTQPTTPEPTTEAPTTEEVIEGETSLAPVSVVVIPGTDETTTEPGTTEGETSFAITPIDDPSGATQDTRASDETAGNINDAGYQSADSVIIRNWMNVCMFAMIAIFIFAVVTEFLPRRKRK